ncbi:MAG: glycosyltransferase [Acidocella sp.]|nr:glycosyltransferase [Acidocella sp.]
MFDVAVEPGGDEGGLVAMGVTGHVDGMEGHYVVGWAASGPKAGSCLIEISTADGLVVARGRAARHRPDLASLGLGRTTLAFRISLKDLNGSGLVHVRADGEELQNSPLLVETGVFDGECTLSGDFVTGWVTERQAVDKTGDIKVSVVDQRGVEVARGMAVRDAMVGDKYFMPSRFRLRLDDCCFGAGEMALSVLADGVRFGRMICDLKLAGNAEIIDRHQCKGWLLAPAAPQREFALEIFDHGERIALARCEHERRDVASVHPGCGTPGFDIRLEDQASGLQMRCLSLRLAGSDHDLFDGPYVMGSREAAVAAGFRAAQIANRVIPGMDAAARAVLQTALGAFIGQARQGGGFASNRARPVAAAPVTRLAIVIPIYRGVEDTWVCIKSVLATRDAARDQIVLINDASPDPQMAAMLNGFLGEENLFLLTNESNRGFIKTVNRGLGFAAGADVLLLNSDTVVFPGAFDELLRVAGATPEIGTVTALSNNATIFSYPHVALRRDELEDVSWGELAALALTVNKGRYVDVPTGHGFCLLIKAEVIRRIGHLDESFGRGYGEENDFCARAAIIGYRNVAAAGVLVMHRESVSFLNEKSALLAQNLPKLNLLYPEYTPVIMAFERQDGLRAARWALDTVRLGAAAADGARFVVVVSNLLEGGTAKAISDIEVHIGYGGAVPLRLRGVEDGMVDLDCEKPLIRARFSARETKELFRMLDAAAPDALFIHQLLGLSEEMIRALTRWAKGCHTVFYAHDFYALCPRVTMIDAIGRFCGGAASDVCARCVEMGGAHETSELTSLSPAAHRAMFAALLGAADHVVAPSADAAAYLAAQFPRVKPEALPHPELLDDVPAGARTALKTVGRDDGEIVLLGAIGPHKGSGVLLDLARRARLTHPHLTFRVIGYTNIDKALRAVGNVTITGAYKPAELDDLLSQTRGRFALFLSCWPETYSYTLSEAVRYGLIPVVPDIGAPAERVRMAGYGVVFGFPVAPDALLDVLDKIVSGLVAAVQPGATPLGIFAGPEATRRAIEIMGLAVVEEGELRAFSDQTETL